MESNQPKVPGSIMAELEFTLSLFADLGLSYHSFPMSFEVSWSNRKRVK